MDSGVTRIDLGVKDFNEAAITLYENRGYQKLHKVYFLKTSKHRLQINQPRDDTVLRSPNPSEDPKVLIKIDPNVWWSAYPAKEELRADIETNPEHFLLLDHKGEIQGYMKYRLGEDVHIDSFAISDSATIPLPGLAICMLIEAIANADKRETVYVEVDEQRDELVDVLKSLSFETYETEFHMTKQLRFTKSAGN